MRRRRKDPCRICYSVLEVGRSWEEAGKDEEMEKRALKYFLACVKVKGVGKRRCKDEEEVDERPLKYYSLA